MTGKLSSTTIRALTICQPYAYLIASGAKPIENRTWETRYRGWLAIHAGKSRAWLNHDDLTEYGERLVFGAVVAVARLTDCVPVDALPAALAGHEHAQGPWCWLLEDVRPLATPVACSGAQGLWEPSPGVLAALTEAA